MKKIFYTSFTVFSILCGLNNAYSQTVITNDTIRLECEPSPVDDEFVFDNLDIKNNSSKSFDFKVRKIIASGDTVTGTETYFCNGACYGVGTYVSTNKQTVASNSSFTEFSTHYKPFGKTGTSIVKYEFFNVNSSSEKVYVVFKITALATPTANTNTYVVNLDFPSSVKENENNKTISVSPNPADNKIFVSFSNNILNKSNLKIYDLLGNLVTEKESNGNDKIEIDTESFSNGIYYLKLEQENKIVSTKKIIVSH
jgi:hypothetical protein